MTTPPVDFAARMLAPYGPTRPIAEMVVEVNRIFHAIEARQYDHSHPEIHEQLPVRWRELLGLVPVPPAARWSLLDFGTGTGFATAQALGGLPAGTADAVTCVDLSPEMLTRCRAHISPLFPRAQFLEQLPASGTFNLLLSNSILHHLPDVDAQLARIERLLAPGAWWILGHEPSSRFYKNTELCAHYAAYLRQNRWSRFLRPSRYLGALRRMLEGDPRRLAARESVAQGLFAREPDPDTIDRLVDFGVAHSLEEAEAGRGLDFRDLEQRLRGRWRLIAARSYSFMGNLFEGKLTAGWQERCRVLAQRFPDDGANFCAVWKREG